MTSRNAPVARSQMNTVESLETPTTIGKYVLKKVRKVQNDAPKRGFSKKSTQIGRQV